MDHEQMLIVLIQEILDSPGYYADMPYVHDLLQHEGRIRDFRIKHGLLYDFERAEEV